jgi:hypothetical protein
MRTFPIWWIEDGACACPEGSTCKSAGKHPITRNGVKDASEDPAQIALWREQYPRANWACATGQGLVVIDLDRKPGKDGVAALVAMAKQHGGLPPTRTIRTGSGGLHLYFSTEKPIGNSVGKNGIDVRGENGYVVAPPSLHASGNLYTVESDKPIAPLPSWLIPAIRPAPAAPQPAARPTFQAASADILEHARNALNQHGPAIEGEGGDLHTFRAGALLLNDFALTEEEAWPLFTAWNETCEPPWNERDLRAKLRGGAKYGTAPYGCKREGGPYEAALRVIEEWSNGGSGTNMPGMIRRLREKVELITDPAEYALVEEALQAATGLKARRLGLPPCGHVPVEAPRGSIEITTDLHDVADQSLNAISQHVFQRGGILCEVATSDRTVLHDLESARIQDLMSRCASYVRFDSKRGEHVKQPAPERVATILQARRQHKGVRMIDSITTAPVFLADGTILQERGYSEQARVFLEPSVHVDLPEHLDQPDAAAAVDVFRDLLCDFKFQEEADFSSWLAGLLSPLVKAATGNAPVPLICISASSPGAGKSLLVEVVARIVTGQAAEIRGYGWRDEGEWAKKLTAFVKAGSPVSVFDNVNGLIGDEALDRLITSATWSDRILGASDAPPLPNVTTWFVTGNNVEPVKDTVRRVLLCRLQVDTEKPQERTGFKRPLLVEYAQENRAELLEAALTILRAYHLAGRPPMGLPSWGSFTVWSELVRNALVWAGAADPFLTQQRATRTLNESDNDAHDFWLDVVNDCDGQPTSIAMLADQRNASDVLGTRERISTHHLRKFLGRFVDKPRTHHGKLLRLRRDGARYYVEEI